MNEVHMNFGWAGPEGMETAFESVASEFMPFQIIGAQSPPKHFMWEYVKRLNNGKNLDPWFQLDGDCVSMGYCTGVDYLYASKIVRERRNEKFKRSYPPFIYGVCRTARDIGNGSLGRGAGAFGSWAVAAGKKYGLLYVDDVDANGISVPKYSKTITSDWGVRGVPKAWYTVAADNIVQSSAKLTKIDQIREALLNHYPVTIASLRAFSTRVVNNNVCYIHNPRDRWPHQMCLTAWKEEGNFVAAYRQNSWGKEHTPKPLNGEPEGGAWQLVEDLEKELRTDVEVYALSDVIGFPSRSYAML